MPIVVGGIPSPISFAPNLLSPANAAYADLSGEVEFEWQYQAGAAGNTQTGWAFRRKLAGASSYSYWNSTTSAWQSTLVFNSGAVSDYTFPSGSWTDGNTYNWSVATQDVNGTGPFAADDTVTAQAPASVTVSAPAGTIGQSQPTITWAPSVPAGASQTSYRVVIYNASQYGAAGFTPGEGASVYDSGVVPSAYVASLACPVALADFTSYQVYVQITETGAQVSNWASSSFTTSYAQPAAPALTAVAETDPDTNSPCVYLTVQGRDNFLSASDALTVPGSGGIGSWAATTGSASESGGVLLLTGESGVADAYTAAYDVVAGTDYSFGLEVAVSGGGTAGSFTPVLNFYDANGDELGTAEGSATPTGSAGVGTGTAPAGTVTAKLGVLVTTGSSGAVLVSNAGLGLSAGVGQYGGFAGIGQASITFSDDDGQTWWALRNASALALPAPGQQATVTDYEAPPGFTRLYQCVVTAGAAVSGGANASCLVTPSLLWWIKDPLDPSANMTVSLDPGTLDTVSQDRQQEYQVLGRPDPVILSDAFELPQLQLTFVFITDAAYQAFEAMRSTQHIFLLQGPAPSGQWYVRFGLTKNDSTNLPSLRGWAGDGNVVRTVQLAGQAVAAP